MNNEVLSKVTKEKIAEIRKKAGRGRQKGYKHSEATKEKIRAGVARVRKPVSEWSAEDRMKILKLEEVMKLAREEAEEKCKKHNIDLIGMQIPRPLEIYALDQEECWIAGYWEFGLDGAFVRVKEMLGWERTRDVGIRWQKEVKGESKFLTGIQKINDEGDYWLW